MTPVSVAMSGPPASAEDGTPRAAETPPSAEALRRRFWLYGEGAFAWRAASTWIQDTGGLTREYRSVAETRESVELEIVANRAKVRFYQDRCELLQSGETRFAKFASGRWTERPVPSASQVPAAVTQPPSSSTTTGQCVQLPIGKDIDLLPLINPEEHSVIED